MDAAWGALLPARRKPATTSRQCGKGHPLRATPQLEFEAALMIVEVDTTFDDDTTEERVFAENLRAAGVDPGPSS
jgi:hypothetical protein